MTKKGLFNTQNGLGIISLFFVISIYYINLVLLPKSDIQTHNILLLATPIILQALSFISLILYKYNDSSFNKMMLMMDIVPLCFFVNIFLLFYSISTIFYKSIDLHIEKIIYALLFIFLVSFLYGLYYGYKRWRTATNEILFDEKNGNIKFYYAFSALSQDYHNSSRYIPLYGLVAVITPFIAHTFGHAIVFLIAAIILIPILPIHISSVLVRRYLFQKHILHKKLILI